MTQTIFNRDLVAIAKDQVEKAAFVDSGAASGAAGGGGAPAPQGAPMAGPMPPMPGMGGDPAAAGGDPAAAAGGAPAGAPVGDPTAGAAPDIGQMINDAVQKALQQQGMGGQPGMAGGKPKMKIDVNTEIYHVKRLLVKLIGMLGGSIEPDMLLGDPAEDPYADPSQAAQDPASAAAQPGAMESAIKPPSPIQGASPATAGGDSGSKKAASFRQQGDVFPDSGIPKLRSKAAALRELIDSASRSVG